MEIIINFRNSWFSIKLFLSSVWRVWRFWCKRLNHEAQQPSLFFGWQEQSTSSLLRVLQACICIFRHQTFFFLTELKNFHIHSISVTFPNLKSNQNDIRKFHDFPDFPELSKSLICKLECNYNLIHAACLFNKLINFPAVLSTKYTKENFLQVFHVWFSVKYRKCT